MHLVWLFFLIIFGQNGHYIAEETAKKVQGASEILVVEGEDMQVKYQQVDNHTY